MPFRLKSVVLLIMIEIRNLTKKFGGITVIDDLSLQLSSQKTHMLIGASGCGKSTLLRLILGLLKPDFGEVLLQGKPCYLLNHSERGKMFGYVLQNAALFPHLSIRKNLELPCEIHPIYSKEELADRVESLCQMVHLPSHLLDAFPFQLSGGQRQRVAICRALLLDPEVLLLDEPLSALDPLIRAELQDELKEIFKRLNKTVIFVSHDLDEAAYLGNWLYLFQKGKIAQEGTARDLSINPRNAYVQKFIAAQSRRST